MMALVSFSDPGIVILPIHRLVHGISASVIDKFKKELAEYFEIRESDSGAIYDSRPGNIRIYGLDKGRGHEPDPAAQDQGQRFPGA